MVDYEDLILQRQEIRDELLEYCDEECDCCPYGQRSHEDHEWICTLKEDY